VSPPQTPEQLPDIIEAISDRRRIRFEYFNQELSPAVRTLEPYQLSNSRGDWYLIGHDVDRNELRTFRLDRFASAVSLISPAQSFTPVAASSLDQEEIEASVAKIKVRKGRGVALRIQAKVIDSDSEWELLEVPYHSEDYLIRQILWLGVDAVVISPESMRTEIIARLEKVVQLHG
jgi:proteasome accessory factor B